MKTSLKQKHLSKKRSCHILTRSFLFCLLLLLGQITNAQDLSDKSRFSVNYLQGCAPFTISLTDLGTVTDNNAPILVDFTRDPNIPESLIGIVNSMNSGGTLDTTYTVPGTYLIGQLNGNVADPADRFDFITVIVTESLPPVFTVATCTNNTVLIDIDFSSDNYEGYLIDFGDGNSMNISKNDPPSLTHIYTVQGNYTITLTGQLTDGFNATCGFTSEDITTILDLPLPTITQLDVQSPTSVTLTYTGLKGNITYQIEATDPIGFVIRTILVPTDNPSSFLFENSLFDFENISYDFSIMATEACGNITGFSNEIASIALNYAAIYNGNQIEIRFDWSTSNTDLTELVLYRNSAEIGRSTEPTGQQLITIDNCIDTPSLQIVGDFNGITSTSYTQTPDLVGTLTPPALATPEILFSGGDILIRWFATPISISEYVIYRQDSDGSFIEIGTTTGTQYADSDLNGSASQVCYLVSYRDECTNESILSEVACETLSSRVLIPTAFRPESTNPDNSTFKIVEGVYRNFAFHIYNRWGVLLFSTTDSSLGWDGSYKGQQSPAGSYVYRLRYFDVDDILTSVSDSFLLIR
jgi:gliding motility-associated-like protein